MIDLNLLRDNPTIFSKKITDKDPSFDVAGLIELDKKLRALTQEIDDLRHQKNELAQKAKKGVTSEIRDASIKIGKELKQKEADQETVKETFQELYLHCPNIPFDEIPRGNKEANKVVKEIKKKPSFSFEPKHHLELATQLGWLDFDAAAQIAGSNFALYKGELVHMLYALVMLMLKNNIRHGYELIAPSVLVNEESLLVASNFPKFKDQVYAIQEDNLYLTPTAEVNLANLYRGHIFQADELPKRMTSWTQCFRREAGGYGAQERGLIRIHQFDKVELFTICTPEQAEAEQERMLETAESILKTLGLHYRVVLLAAQDCSFASAKTYDIEVWMPGQQAYYEVSSISNCTDFQARRGKIRYRKEPNAKPEYVFTLNGSSLALPRLIVAIMETCQQENGTIVIPEVLKKEGLWCD